MAGNDPALGTQELSRILRCAPRTIAKLIDSGQLPGFKVPGSKHRRVLRSDFVRFCERVHMPPAIVSDAERAATDEDEDPDLLGDAVRVDGPDDGQPLACGAMVV